MEDCYCTECRLDRVALLPDDSGLAADRVTGREEIPSMAPAEHKAFGAVVTVSYCYRDLTDLYASPEMARFFGFRPGGND